MFSSLNQSLVPNQSQLANNTLTDFKNRNLENSYNITNTALF